MEVDTVMLAVGRHAVTDGVGLEEVGVQVCVCVCGLWVVVLGCETSFVVRAMW